MDNQSPILRMQGITKRFGATLALEDVDFMLYPGEVHILAGENGAGKSTLMKILGGVHSEYEGRIELEGRPVRFRSPQEAAEQGISIIHQELSLVPSLSVADNIFLGREKTSRRIPGWVQSATQKRECSENLQRLGLDISPDVVADSLPLSLQQMVEITKALSLDARVVVMDEPTSALNEPEVERLFQLMADLKAGGCAIVYITHKMEEIEQVGDRITVLRDGRFVGARPAVDLSREEMIRWMVGREMEEQFPRHQQRPGPVKLAVENFSLPDPGGKPRPVVQKVSFEVRAGEILGLAGLQGSGSSELLAGLFGAYGNNFSGRILLDNQPFRPGSPREAIRQGLALLTNDRKTTGLILDAGIQDNLTLATIPKFSPAGWRRKGRERQAARNQRQTLGIRTIDLDLPVTSLSGGNQQKVVLGKWLETEPRVLLLDEPTRGVDVGAKREIYELMNQWTAEGKAIVLITSEMPELLALSDRIVVMHRGRVTAEFSRDSAEPEGILKAAMGGENPERNLF
jgi:ribose transport system ATP-binding protein